MSSASLAYAALSVHSFITKVGDYAGFLAIIGVALLVIMYFVHARETAILRERAEDAEERLAQLEFRVDQAARTATTQKAAADHDVAVATVAMRSARPADLAALRGPAAARLAPTAIAGGGIALEALRAALTQQGKPYVWGATGDATYDCSGLVWWAYRQIGIAMPRTAAEQAQVGTPIAPQDAQVGDLVFFGAPVTHVGIYVGNGHMLNAPQSGDVVKVANVQRNLTAIRRVSL